MPQQLNFLAEAAVRGPKGRAPPPSSGPSLTRRSAPAQESLFEFQAVGDALVPVPGNAVPPPSPPTLPPDASAAVDHAARLPRVTTISSGDKAKARDILAAIRTLQAIEQAQRQPTPEERHTLTRFPGFGCVALGIFPDPVKGTYKDAGWQRLGEELEALLSPEQYASAKRTTFTAFYTSPVVIKAMHDALQHLGVPDNATVLEPGCGIGNFIAQAPHGMQFIGIELDDISGRIAKALYRAPDHFIRIEHFRDTKLPENRIDAVIGNVPFADIKHDYWGERLSLHDFFLAKSLDALKPGGVLALVTSHYTLDRQHAGLRQQLAQRADLALI